MNAKDLRVGEVYALGRGDVRRDYKEFRKVAFVRRPKPVYDQFNRTKQINRGRVIIKMLDDPYDYGDASHFQRYRSWIQPKGEELEVDPQLSISWTWAEFEGVVGKELAEEAQEAAKEKEVRTYFAEIGVGEQHLNLGRHSLYHDQDQVNMMIGHGELDECDVNLPFKILRKLVAGTEITEEDWKRE